MDDVLVRIAQDMVDRVTGPTKLRLVIQPLMAIIQRVVRGFIYPGEAVLFGPGLAIAPYLVVRGATNRLVR